MISLMQLCLAVVYGSSDPLPHTISSRLEYRNNISMFLLFGVIYFLGFIYSLFAPAENAFSGNRFVALDKWVGLSLRQSYAARALSDDLALHDYNNRANIVMHFCTNEYVLYVFCIVFGVVVLGPRIARQLINKFLRYRESNPDARPPYLACAWLFGILGVLGFVFANYLVLIDWSPRGFVYEKVFVSNVFFQYYSFLMACSALLIITTFSYLFANCVSDKQMRDT